MAKRAKQKAKSKLPHRQCGTMSVHYRLMEQDPSFRTRLLALEDATRTRMSMAVTKVKTLTIPVVVHVVYHTKAENISTTQIKSQIAAMNRDYRAKNADKSKVPAVWAGLVADTNVQFKLATRDPKGKTTSGITRNKTAQTGFGDDDAVKASKTGGANPWPSNKYLNLWVCNLEGGLLGYAQFPGGPAKTDGVVITYTAFGTTGTAASPFDRGRTAVHEVGHWLNLHHVWGDGGLVCSDSDSVDDTPNQEGPNYGKPKFPHVSCKNGPNGDMFVNYMDYVDDAVMVMFSPQQVNRMQAALSGLRSGVGV
jgi:hypothetical protein